MASNRITTDVTLTPPEAALAYLAVLSINVPGERVRDAASLLTKVEAAMEPIYDNNVPIEAELVEGAPA